MCCSSAGQALENIEGGPVIKIKKARKDLRHRG